ncbi:hypothetical protein PIB30_096395 [Stylosanthes scabra]|uniref:Uncharacterized protein n=1 Tax=Stylosanthes scabra TaxID=79078 RepID=A0ABU6TY35_9FABA|nr:hypothetical protein [Stylosanthes scabra]
MASSSSVSVFDNHRFKSVFNEELYNTIVKNKKLIAEVYFDLMDDEYPEIREQIALRGWRRLAAPKTEISETLIHEFYANAIITEEEMEEHGGHSYKSFVRGVPVNFSPEKILSVMRFKAQDAGVPLREFRRTTKISAEKPITARRMESTRLPRNLQHQPQDNEDEDKPMTQAEEGHEEEQRGEHDYQHHQPEYDHQPEFQHEPQFQQPPLYEIPTYTDQHEKDLHSIEELLQNMMWLQQQCLENINKSQVEYMAELRTIKGKQQEMFENNDRFYNQVREEHREIAKEIQQVKNYQVNQTMVEFARNKALMEELAAVKTRQEEFFSNQTNQYNMIRKEQNLLGKEILDVKKHQMNTVTMGSSSSPQKYEPDQALMKIREQHANFSEVQSQLKEWTKN